MTKTTIAGPLVWNRTRRRHITYESVSWHSDILCLHCKYSISLSPFTMNVTSNLFVCYSEGVRLKCYFGIVSIGELTCLAAWYIAFRRKNFFVAAQHFCASCVRKNSLVPAHQCGLTRAKILSSLSWE